MTTKLSDFVKAYDVRGVVPDQLNIDVAHALGAAFAEVVALADGASAVVIGHDMRPSSPELVDALARGITARGVDAVLIGLASTDGLYYASGALGLPGAMFTASHNPAKYNGIKFCRSGARPVGQDTGLADIRDLAQQHLVDGHLDDIGVDPEAEGQARLGVEVDEQHPPSLLGHRRTDRCHGRRLGDTALLVRDGDDR